MAKQVHDYIEHLEGRVRELEGGCRKALGQLDKYGAKGPKQVARASFTLEKTLGIWDERFIERLRKAEEE